jgi:hypothetical protein
MTAEIRRKEIWVAVRQLALPLLLGAFLGYLYFNRIQGLLFKGAYIDLGTWAHLAYAPTAFNQDPSTYYPSLLEYFRTHFRPLIVLLSAPSAVLPLNLVDNVSLIFAAEAMLIAVSAAIAVLALRLPLPPFVAGLLAALTGLAFYLSAPNLSALGYPHFEPLFAPLTVLFFVAFATGHLIWAAIALGILLGVREDMGLHFGLFVLVFATYALLVDKIAWRKISFLVLAGVLALSYTALARLIQLHFFPGGHVLVGDYLGDPLYAHVTKDFLAQRLSAFWQERGYILIAFLATLGLASYYRRPQYLLGYVLYFPWLVFNLLAVKDTAGALSTYRMYPFALALIWPIVYEALRIDHLDDHKVAGNQHNSAGNQIIHVQMDEIWTAGPRQRLFVALTTILVCASTAFIASPSLSPVKNFNLAKSSERNATLLLMTFLAHDQHHRLGLRVSRSVAAVGSNEIKKTDVVPKWILARSDLPSRNGMLFHASARDACDALHFASENGFDRIVRLGKSNVFVAFRSDQGNEIIRALQEFNQAGLSLAEASFPIPVLKTFQSCNVTGGLDRPH